jgi:hypothetical protein
MNEDGRTQQEDPRRGPSLFVLYGIVALLLAAAIALAVLIVLPFYRRR